MNTGAFNLAWLSLMGRAKVYNSRASFRKRCQEGGKSMCENFMGGGAYVARFARGG